MNFIYFKPHCFFNSSKFLLYPFVGTPLLLNDTFEEEAVLMHDALHEAYMDGDMDHADEVGSGVGPTAQGDGDNVDVGGLDPFMSDPR